MLRTRGIDVSNWQGSIDWKAVAEENVRFAMICLGHSCREGAPVLDSYFTANLTHALENGIPVGVYFRTCADSPQEAQKEAVWTTDALKPYQGKITYPVVLNMEAPCLRKQSREQNTAIADAYCRTIEENGYCPMYYASLSFLTDCLRYEQLKQYDLWLSHSKEPDAGKYACSIWQYSSSGILSGIEGYTSLNDSVKDYAGLISGAELPKLKDRQEETSPQKENISRPQPAFTHISIGKTAP